MANSGTDARRLPLRRDPDPVRALRRCPGGDPPRRPRRPRGARPARASPGARSTADRRCSVRRCQRRRGGQPQRGPDGGPARGSAHGPAGGDGQPPVRILAGGGDSGQPPGRDRRRLVRARRRGGVDVARSVDPAQARARPSGRPRDPAFEHARMADGQPENAGAVDDLARGEHREARRDPRRHARGPGRVRAAQPHARRGGMGRRLLFALGRAGAGYRPRGRREHPPRHDARETRATEAGVHGPGHRHRRQRLTAQRRRRRGADRR